MAEQRRNVHPPVISRELGKELEQYNGQWVAIDEQRIVASADSLPEVLRLAGERGFPDPLPFHVPTHPEIPFIGSLD
jgi:hypothetical protein